MPYEEHVRRLLEGVDRWNEWRSANAPLSAVKSGGSDTKPITPCVIDLTGANLPAAQLSRADLESADLSCASLRGANLLEANLSGANLLGADLQGVDLRRASLRDAKLGGANLRGAKLGGADLRCADLSNPDLDGVRQDGARGQGANPRGADLSGADMNGANLSDADLRGANLSDATLGGANLSGAKLSYIHLSGVVNLHKADLRGVRLTDAKLRHVNLSGANLLGADLRRVDLIDADLDGANLTGAKLDHADLSGARLRGAKLAGANLSSTNLSVAILGGADLTGAKLWETSFVNIDLRDVIGLETCKHLGPSIIDHRTLERSGRLPLPFLRGIGLPDTLIEYLPSLTNTAIQFYSCFISYSAMDQEFAERLHADLQSRAVRCWFAPHDMPIGARILDEIDSAIRLREKLLLILSEHSIRSDWVEDEVTTAFEEERRRGQVVLFPVRLDNSVLDTDEAWAAKLRGQRNIGDFRQWKDHDAYKKVFERVLRDLTVPGTS